MVGAALQRRSVVSEERSSPSIELERRGPPGKVWLVGAGPGDPELLTVKAHRCLARADVVVYDALVDPAVLALAPSAEHVFAGKRCGRHSLPQEAIHAVLIEHASRSKEVVRLKGGDPFVFGRGGEEALALAAAGIPFEVVPGVTSGVAVPAAANIPVTHRGIAAAVTFVTGHGRREDVASVRWDELARVPGTLVVFMGLGAVGEIARGLVAGGRGAETPVAVIARGTTPDQLVVEGTLADIAERVARASVEAPALVVVGEVLSVRRELERLAPAHCLAPIDA